MSAPSTSQPVTTPASVPPALAGPFLAVIPWRDAVVERVGFDARSAYVELFWLSVLGPTSTWLLRRIVGGLDEFPLGYELDLAETAGAMGLSYSPAPSNPFTRAIQRCVMFGVAHHITGGVAVRRTLPPVPERHVRRMPAHLQVAHASWVAAGANRAVTPDRRAELLAEAMVAAGDDPDVVERQLLGLGVAPAVVLDVLRRTAHRTDAA